MMSAVCLWYRSAPREGGKVHDPFHLNKYRGGAGRDVIDARNGARDVVDCGGGHDVARVDDADRVRRCERVIVRR